MGTLLEKLAGRQATVAIIGAGHVGLPLAVAFAQEGLRCIALDKSRRKVQAIAAGRSYLDDVPSDELGPLVRAGRLRASSDEGVLAEADAVVVCVPTPLDKTKTPDLQYVVEAAQTIAAHQHPGMLVVLESTTYPGTTTEVLVPRLTRGSYELGEDVFIAYSPERVDPGNRRWHTRNTPKLIAGATPQCLELATALYGMIIETLVPVSSPDTAELAKLLENTFRQVNIALANELALMARRLGVDIWEVIDAAATKPFGFMPFYPGPGLGGRCIPCAPLYLSWRMRSLEGEARLIDLADLVNSAMPQHVVGLVRHALDRARQSVNGSRLLVVGVAYKKDVPDYRGSPAQEVMASLRAVGARVDYLDPHVPALDGAGLERRSVPPDVCFADYDAIVILTDHSDIDYQRLLREARLVVDTRNALGTVPGDRRKIVKL
ncbi:MAG: nucleotide sugar dehydrogenase [Deltaproteobacteria bacterium]|nr:nucleotide sugar dehydrogenase [Deltaproteobacteria bacterium]